MPPSELIVRLQPIFREILDQPDLSLSPTLAPADCANWDSVAQVQLLVAVEQAFDIQFATSEVATFKSVADYLAALRRRGFQD